jgi:hypothetical protein
VPIAISAEQRALQASIRGWAARAGTLALVRAPEPDSTAGAPGSPAGRSGSQAGDAVDAFLLSRCLSIAGGASQILPSVVAERALGLPRDEAR